MLYAIMPRNRYNSHFDGDQMEHHIQLDLMFWNVTEMYSHFCGEFDLMEHQIQFGGHHKIGFHVLNVTWYMAL